MLLLDHRGGHCLPCVLYKPYAMEVMELCGEEEEIEVLHSRLHIDYVVSRGSPFGHVCFRESFLSLEFITSLTFLNVYFKINLLNLYLS